MGSSIYGIGVSGLRAAQLQLMVTSHNVTNASTPGYHRQNAAISSARPQFTGAGFVGQGVSTDNVLRVYDRFLDTQVAQAESLASYYQTHVTLSSQLDDLVTDPGTSLTSVLKDFFAAVQDLTARPEHVPTRQALLAQANSLVNRFQLLDARVDDMASAVRQHHKTGDSGRPVTIPDVDAGPTVTLARTSTTTNRPATVE